MYESTQHATWTHGIDLAQEADFDLGSLRVRPATCEVEWNGVCQTLQRRVMQVLVALAQARGTVVSQDDFVVRCWRGLSVSDDAIFRCISKLRKLAGEYPDAPYSIETIPGVGYRLTAGKPDEAGATNDAAAAPARRSSIGPWAAAAAVAVSILLVSAIWISQGRRGGAHDALSVTVQPFETLSDSNNTRTLARRIPNEVVDALGDSQVEAALAGGRSGSPEPTGSPGLIVTGILHDDGSNTIVDARIEDGATHAAFWSTEFKRDRREASDLPLEVAARVADVVNMINFARSANPPLKDGAALSALLQVTDMIRDPAADSWAQMVDRAQSVVARHPEFAFGHSVLAAAYAEAAEDIHVPDQSNAMRDAARREARLTLQLDPKDAGAYGALAGLAFARQPYNYRAGEEVLLRGIKSAKHPKEPVGALYQYEGNLLASVGRLREGLSYQLTAQAMDRWSPAKMTRLALVYANMGNSPAAADTLQKAVERWPNNAYLQGARQYIPGFYEPPSDALAAIDMLDAQASPDRAGNATWRAFIQARAARSGPVTDAAVRTIRGAADEGKIPRETEIMMLAALGETSLAMSAANSALDHQQLDSRFLFTPVTRSIREDQGFIRLADRMGLIRYWRETGKLPDFCTDRAAQGECSPQLRAAVKAKV